MGQCSTMGEGPKSRLRDPSNHVSRTFIREMGTLRPERKSDLSRDPCRPSQGSATHAAHRALLRAPRPSTPLPLKPGHTSSQLRWAGAASLLGHAEKIPVAPQGSHPKVSTPRELNQLPLARVNGERTSSQGGQRNWPPGCKDPQTVEAQECMSRIQSPLFSGQ